MGCLINKLLNLDMVCLPLVSEYAIQYTVELQWLEHRWLVYHSYFELVLESLGKNSMTSADFIIFEIMQDDFLFYIDNGILCVLIRIASMRQF